MRSNEEDDLSSPLLPPSSSTSARDSASDLRLDKTGTTQHAQPPSNQFPYPSGVNLNDSVSHCQESKKDAPSLHDTPPRATNSPANYSHYMLRLWSVIRPFQAFTLLFAVSTVNSLIGAQMGQIAGGYYKSFVDKDVAAFVALAWRNSVDNPDQRISADVALFSASLSRVASALASAPVALVIYAIHTYRVFDSMWPILAALTFFVTGAVLQHFLASAVASAVWRQEKLEGNFRAAHGRLRASAVPISLWRGASAELAGVTDPFTALAKNQLGLVLWRWALGLITTALDYSGAMVAYLCVAVAVFSGIWQQADGPLGGGDEAATGLWQYIPVHLSSLTSVSTPSSFGAAGDADVSSPGDIASLVSNGTFFLLSLVYNFTRLLDLASEFSSCCALGSRIGTLFRAMERGDKEVEGDASPYLPPPPPSPRSHATSILRGNSGVERDSSAYLPPPPPSPRKHTTTILSGAEEVEKDLSADLLPPLPPPSPHHHPSTTTHLCANARGDKDEEGGTSPNLPPLPPPDEQCYTATHRPEPGPGPTSDSQPGFGVPGSQSARLDANHEKQNGNEQSHQPNALGDPQPGPGAPGSQSARLDANHDSNAVSSTLSTPGPHQALLQLHSLTVWRPQGIPGAAREGGHAPVVDSVARDGPGGPCPRGLRGSCPRVPGGPCPRGLDDDALAYQHVVVDVRASESILSSEGEWKLLKGQSTSLREAGGKLSMGHSTSNRASDRKMSLSWDPYRMVYRPHEFLVKDLDLKLFSCQRLLVSGPDACGKSTLALLISDLWRHYHGYVQLNVPHSKVIVLPQAPLAGPGRTLREQVLYPDAASCQLSTNGGACGHACRGLAERGRVDISGAGVGLAASQLPSSASSDARLEAVLHAVGLSCLLVSPAASETAGQPVHPLDICRDWNVSLSPGQLQRLALARALRLDPEVLVLDEATAALPEEEEEALYRVLINMGVAIISMGHRSSLRALHTHELCIDGDGLGGWQLQEL
eukprot:gene31168-6310_t